METILRKKGRLKKAIIPMLICILAAWIIIVAGVIWNEHRAFPEAAASAVVGMFRDFDERSKNIRNVDEYGKATNELLIKNVGSAYIGYDFVEANNSNIFNQVKELKDLIADSDISALHIVSPGGKIYLTTDMDDIVVGDSIVLSGVLTQKQFDQLKKTAQEMDMKAITRNAQNSEERDYQEPVVVEDEEGRREFYAAVSTGKARSIYSPGVDNYVIMECRGKAEDAFHAMLTDLSVYFAMDDPDGGYSSFLIDSDTGIITYGSRDNVGLIGEKAADHGIELDDVMHSDGEKTFTIDGKRSRVYTARYHSNELGNNVLVYVYQPFTRAMAGQLIAVMLLIAAAVIIITVCGITMEETDMKAVTRKMAGMAILAEVLITAAAFYFMSVGSISWAMHYTPRVVEAFVESTRDTAEDGAKVSEFYQRRLVSIARSTRTFLEGLEEYALNTSGSEESMEWVVADANGNTKTVPDLYGNPTLSIPASGLMEGLCYMGAYDRMYVLDTNGRAIASSGNDWHYDIISGQHGSDAEVMKVLHREKSYHYQMNIDESGMETGSTIAVPLNLYVSNDTENGRTVYHCRKDYDTDKTGTIEKKNGVLMIVNDLDNTISMGFRASAYSSLSALESSGSVLASLVSAEPPHQCLDYHMLTESEVGSFGFTDEEYLHDSYRFSISPGGDVFASLMKLGDLNELENNKEARNVRLLLAFDQAALFRFRTGYSVFLILVSLILCLISCLIVRKEKREELKFAALETPEQRMERSGQGRELRVNAGVVIREEKSVASTMIRIFLYLAAVILFSIGIVARRGTEGSFFSYMVRKQWARDLNIFSVSYVMYLTVIITAALMAARSLVEAVASSLKPAVETVVRLILSIIQYAGIMILLFYCLQLLGVQTGTVITFGGIITGVIGLGANSLISDIIAGLFIIFEREFRVNDIVTIDNFTGVVRGIGLRTTRIQDTGGNVKTFNNSKITNVLNLTENYSTSFATVNVGLEVPVEQVETLVNTELPRRMANNTDIVEGPWFSGIMEIKNGFYTISVGARCEQQKKWRVKTELTKHLLMLLKENDIRIA